MPRSVNKTFLLGNVGKDPQISSTAGGGLAANSSLATTDREKDQQGIGPTGRSGTTWLPTGELPKSFAIL
jgi:single-stranded DNA-binding protein